MVTPQVSARVYTTKIKMPIKKFSNFPCNTVITIVIYISTNIYLEAGCIAVIILSASADDCIGGYYKGMCHI